MKKVEVADVRCELVYYFQSKAGYRRSLSEKYPRDAEKNVGYADSLELVASYVSGLPDDDPVLLALAGCEAL